MSRHTYRFLAGCQDHGKSCQEWLITGEEFQHLKRVLRLQLGELVEVFDGQGHSARGTISRIEGQTAAILAQPLAVEKAPSFPLALAIGALRPGSIDELIPFWVELGVDEIHVFLHGQAAKARLQDKILQRWEKIIIAASKQCKRALLPTLHCWQGLEPMLMSLAPRFTARYFLDPAGSVACPRTPQAQASICAVIGGEHGFNHEEEASLKAAEFTPICLGPRVLRALTAAIATATLLSHPG